ncbi:alpha/beta hydrolase [Aquamicrobium terrae]|uniref:Pimeloyl-ACP methyl ester carboxylesterase n=1 Tax=Aquamicrobium terrae TaxID=1324945 RepID=A0ABV2MYR0_9HYPH
MIASQVEFLDVDGTSIAVRRQEGDVPGVVWLGGYKSDMLGTKAEALAEWAAGQGRAFVRHDYSGHGESGGAFEDGTISKWLRESLAVFARYTRGPQVLVGSSMGGWVALRMVQELLKAGESRVRGLVLIAPAPDFTAELVEPAMTGDQRRDLAEQGYFQIPSDYADEPYIYTRALIEDGRDNLMMGGPIDTHCPVHILQGMLDDSVPHGHALKLVSLLPADDVTLSLVPDGDHRLSRPQDIELLIGAVREMTARASQPEA